MARPTRRAVLHAGAVGVVGVASAVGWSAPAAAASAPGGSFTADGVGLRRVDPLPRSAPGRAAVTPPSAGERGVVVGTVVTADGSQGTFHADVVRLHDRGQPPHGGVASTLEQHLFTFGNGTLVGSGTSDSDGNGVFAIVGGTGAYATRRGSYAAQQRRADLGGDGTARFVFTLSG